MQGWDRGRSLRQALFVAAHLQNWRAQKTKTCIGMAVECPSGRSDVEAYCTICCVEKKTWEGEPIGPRCGNCTSRDGSDYCSSMLAQISKYGQSGRSVVEAP